MIKKSLKTFLYLMVTFLILSQFAYALNIVELSPGYYPNTSRGRPLSSADIYVGKPDLDPEIIANQKTLSVQQENGTIVTVSQPIHTNAGGVPQYAGSPVVLLVEGDYSLKVLDSHGTQIYYIPSTAYEKYLVEGNYYYPDYAEADQGVVGGGETITDILADVGATENATMYFSHNSGGNTTTYTVTTNTTISDNYNVIIEDGAILNGAGTLTIDGSLEADLYQIFGSSITIAGLDFTESVWFSSLNKAVESSTKVVHITPNTANILTATVNISSNQTIYGDGIMSLVELGANIDAFTIDGKTNVTIKDFKIDGKKATYTTTSNNAICSPANGTGSSNIKIEGMTIVDVAGNSIEILSQTGSHTENVMILDNTINSSGGCAIVCQDYVDDVIIKGNRIIEYAQGLTDRPAIATGRTASNQIVEGNYIEGTGDCGGTSSHAISIDNSTNATVVGNIIKGTMSGFGIEVGGLCLNVSVTGNSIASTTRAGIAVTGDDDTSIVCKHVSIVGNTIFEPNPQGIYVYVSNYVDDEHEDITIVGNTIHNPKTEPGIYCDYTINGVIANNTIVDAYKAGISLDNCDYINIHGNMIKNANTSDTVGNDFGVVLTSCTFCPINGYLELHTASITSSGTGEDTLETITIPQNYHMDWKGLRFKAAGVKTGGNGNKTIKFYWGTGEYTFNAAANDTNDWRVEGEILFNGEASQRVSWLGWNGATPLQGFELDTEDLSAAGVVLKLTGECVHADDVINQVLWILEVF